ncbi:MAG: hypothetical protein GY820_42920 [Gammaproteobacteria bacterium]|nr:hypothetical protein [Gammaproteobacteria bacterium]
MAPPILKVIIQKRGIKRIKTLYFGIPKGPGFAAVQIMKWCFCCIRFEGDYCELSFIISTNIWILSPPPLIITATEPNVSARMCNKLSSKKSYPYVSVYHLASFP